MSSKKAGRVTRAQIITMLDYFAANPTLAEKNIQKHFTKEELNKKWEEMTALLHAADGPEKTIDQWQVVWRDMKSRTKMKLKDCRQKIQTGESISTNNTFSDLELRVIDILGTEDADSIKSFNNSATERRSPSKRNIISKFEPMNEDSYSDPLSVQQIEEEYVEYDEDYVEETQQAKKMKTMSYSTPAVSRESKKSFLEITKIQANAMMMQAEAAKTCAEASKLNAEAAKMYASAANSNAEALNKLADAINLAVEAFSHKKIEHF